MPSSSFQAATVCALKDCSNFTIRGGTFTLNTTVEKPQRDFRLVPLGDLNLLDEIARQNMVEHRVIRRKRTGAFIRRIEVVVGTRRVYRARIFGRPDPMTVFVSDDPQFEQRKHEAQSYRHPSLVQLFGFTCSAGMNAVICHDEMMPIEAFERIHARSALALRYIQREMMQHFDAAAHYWNDITRTGIWDVPGTGWIRISTGKLCLNVGDGDEPLFRIQDLRRSASITLRSEWPSLNLMDNDLHDKLLCTFDLDDLYTMLRPRAIGFLHLPYTGTINLPSIYIKNNTHYRAAVKLNQLSIISSTKNLTPSDIFVGPWNMYNDKVFEVLPTGWTRVEASEVSTQDLGCLQMRVKLILAKDDEPWKWRCSQENYVWTHLKNVISPDESWDFITELEFAFFIYSQWDTWTLQGTFMADLPPDDVYLFLFRPQVVLVDDKFTVTTPPDSEKYYWAFDLAGFDRLTQQTAKDIGLPRLEFSLGLTDPRDRWRDDEIIGEFHAAKGFDPDGQDVAIARGYPLVGIKDTSKSSQEPTCDRSTNCGGDEAEDGIYYSLGLC